MIPKDPNMARIGGRTCKLQYDDRFIHFYAAAITKQPSHLRGENIGYAVHAHCWALLNHIISTALVEKNMEKFVRAARKYWRNHESWGRDKDDELSEIEDDDSESWGSDDWSLRSWKLRFGKYHPGFRYGCDIYKNPLIVPKVQEAIEKAIDRASKTEAKSTQLRCSPVPLEVAIMIAERTCPIDYTPADVMDTRNMLAVWQWKLPDGFWKRRLKEEIFIELNSLREANHPIDWQTLWLDLMGLVSDREWYVPSGLPNRERVLGFMTGIKSNFFEMK